MKTGRRHIFPALILAAVAIVPAAKAKTVTLTLHGIQLVAVSAPDGARFDIPIVSEDSGLKRIHLALGHLVKKSSFSRTALRTLKENGRVVILYDPRFPRREVTKFTVAAFTGKQSDDGRNEFRVIVGRQGIKWPSRELAAVIAHELVGHGIQYLQGRLGSMREMDRECEAWLYEEKAIQDIGINKKSRDMVIFRQQLERRHCADFKHYMALRTPRLVGLWDKLNPDVDRLLAIFESYLRHRTKGGAVSSG